MDQSSGCRRPQLDDYEAIDRAMLDCFAESMDYNLGTSSIAETDDIFIPDSNQNGDYQCNNSRSSDKKLPSRKRLQSAPISSFNMLYPSQSNYSSDCGFNSYYSESAFSGPSDQYQTREPVNHSTFSNNGVALGQTNKKVNPAKLENLASVLAVPVSKSELKSQNVIVSRERRRERNKFLARKTRVKKKAEVESLWAQVSQLRTENERLKEAVRQSNPKTSESILFDCDFNLPKAVVELVDRMVDDGRKLGMIKSSSRSFCITNATAPDGPIVYASRDFVELTGYSMHSILGHNCRFLQGPETDRNELNKLKKAIEEGREETVTIKNYRKDGSAFWNRTQISPMRDNNGNVNLIVGLQTEVFRSYNNGEVFTSLDSHSDKNDQSNFCGSTTGSSESYGCSSNGEGGNGGSEDGTTDCTNDEESHNGSTNGSEVDGHST